MYDREKEAERETERESERKRERERLKLDSFRQRKNMGEIKTCNRRKRNGSR